MGALRAQLNRIGIGLLALCLLVVASSCAPSGDAVFTRFEQTHVGLFDTAYTFVAYMPDQAAFDRLDAALYDELNHYHELFDVYHTYEGVTNLCTVNAAGGDPVEVDPDVTALLQFGLDMNAQTQGALNIACGKLSALWTGYREAANRTENPVAALPSEEEIQAALAQMDIGALQVDGQQVSLTKPDVALDVGAIAKGYAARKAVALLRENGVTSAMLNMGGTVCTIGVKADASEPWSVGVADPDRDGAYLMALNVTDRSVATSGDYERYFEVDGVRYCHILDPETGYPANTVRSVTVIAEDAALADAMSTALFVLPIEEGKALIEDTPNAEALWVKPDGSTTASSGWDATVRTGS